MKKNRFTATFINYYYIFLLYIAVGCFFIYFLRYYIDGVDTLDYISISRKYVNGDFHHAINDYWSPMISWLLIPFLLLKMNPFLAFRVLQLLIGAFTIKISIDFIEPIKIKLWMKLVLYFSFIILVLAYGQLYGSPDLLFLTLLLYYLKIISDYNYCVSHSAGIKAGICGGFIFLAKSFGFPFFIVHFTVIHLFYWFSENNSRKILLKNFINGFLAFALIAGVWIGAMSYKNKAVTIGESGRYNFSISGPDYSFKPECQWCYPINEQGLFKPANETAVNITENLPISSVHAWNPFSSRSNFKHWLLVIKTNLASIYYLDFKRQTGVVLLITFIAFLLTSGKWNTLPKQAAILFISFLIYNSGYILVIVNHRYIWINTIVFIVLLCFLLLHFQNNSNTRAAGTALFLFFIFFLVKRPLKELFFLKDRDTPVSELVQAVLHPVNTLENSTQPHKHLFEVISELQKRTDIYGRVANRKRKLTENYKNTALISFCLGNKHYGELTDVIIQREGYQQLSDYGIDYYYTWKPLTKNDSILIMPAIYTDSISGLNIYKVRK